MFLKLNLNPNPNPIHEELKKLREMVVDKIDWVTEEIERKKRDERVNLDEENRRLWEEA